MTTLAVGNRRLLRLAEILEKVPNRKEKDGKPKFWMGSYVHRCGTPACAAGWWAHANPRRWRISTIPTLKDRSKNVDTTSSDLEKEFALDSTNVKTLPFDKGLYGPSSIRIPADQVAKYFEVTLLFGSGGMGGAKTGRQAARFIRRFVKWRTAEAQRAE